MVRKLRVGRTVAYIGYFVGTQPRVTLLEERRQPSKGKILREIDRRMFGTRQNKVLVN